MVNGEQLNQEAEQQIGLARLSEDRFQSVLFPYVSMNLSSYNLSSIIFKKGVSNATCHDTRFV